MSVKFQELTKAQMQEKLRVLHHAMKIREMIISTLITEQDLGRMHMVMHYLTALARADIGYLILFNGAEILTVDLYTEDDAVRFRLDQGATDACPEVPHVVGTPHDSLVGGLRLADSLVLPVVRGKQCIGFMEIGNFRSALQPGRCHLLMSVHRHLVEPFWVLHDHLVNLSAQRSLRAQLDQAQKMYQTIMSGSHDMILSMDTRCTILGINEYGRSLLGLDGGDAGRLQIGSPDIGYIVGQLENGTALSDIEVALDTRDGRHLFCLASFSAEWNEKNEIASINGVFKDITDRIEAQRELWQANIELSEANQQLKVNQQQMVQQEKLASIGQLAAGVAHEINNPLGFVRSNHLTLKQYIERLLAYISKLETLGGFADSLRAEAKVAHLMADLPQLLAESDEGYHRIIKIVQSLKDFSRIDAMGALASVDLNKAIDDTLTVARNSWKYVANVETDYRLADAVECFLDELNQVFLNIVVNAAQAIAEERRDGSGLIRVVTWGDADHAYIQIDDNGPGIPEKIRNRVFDPFFTTKPIGQGTGLGLSMAYDTVVKKHGGEIRILDSELGGASFRICLPLMQGGGARELNDAVT